MINKEIGGIFDFISETNLTEEYFYNHQGCYPVYSGQTENEGIIAQIDTYNQDSPCITFTTYGSAGKLYYREDKYTIGRNCMGLRPKEEYKEFINLEWFIFHFQNLFYKLRIGDPKGQKSLNKLLLERAEIEIPELEVQEKQLKKYTKLHKIKNSIEEIISNLSKSARRFHKYYLGCNEEKELDKIFHINGGNSGLTEDFVYYNLPSNEEETIEIFTGATLEENKMGIISRFAKPNSTKLKVFQSPAILVVRKGLGGKMFYIGKNEFTTNDDAYVLMPKKDWEDKINLKWFIHEYQVLFFNLVTSKSDNATFSKKYAERQIIQIPHIDEQNRIIQKLTPLKVAIQNLQKVENKIDELLEYSIA